MPLSIDDISDDWVEDLCRILAGRSPGSRRGDIQVHSFRLKPLADEQGIISRYEKSTTEAIVGHHVLTLEWVAGGEERESKLIMKVKVPGAVIRERLQEVYRELDSELAELQQELSPSILDDCHLRELHIYELDRVSLKSVTPVIEHIWLDPSSQIFAIVMEFLEHMRHEKTLDDLNVWNTQDMTCVLSGIAKVHGEFLGELSVQSPPSWLLPYRKLNNAKLLQYQASLLRYNADTFPGLFYPGRVKALESFLESARARHRAIVDRPLTLIHGDFTPRNVCLRPKGPGQMSLCAYDWELAQMHLPQRDICEFLCYVLDPSRGWRAVATETMLEQYRRELQAASGCSIERADFQQDMALALEEFCTFKLLVQGITHQLLGKRGYFERLVRNSFDGIARFTQY